MFFRSLAFRRAATRYFFAQYWHISALDAGRFHNDEIDWRSAARPVNKWQADELSSMSASGHLLP